MAVVLCCTAPEPIEARASADQAAPFPRLDLPAQPVATALAAIASAFDITIGMAGHGPDGFSAPLHGRESAAKALQTVLAGTGWQAVQLGARIWRVEQVPSPATRRARPIVIPPEGEPLTITGTKRALSLRQVPMGGDIVVLGEAVAMQPPTGAAELAARVPGLSFGGPGSGQERMFLGGVADSAFNGAAPATVAVLLDNARVSYSGASPDLRLIDMARVEILEGPQGTLYGAGTLGGIYRMVTNRPDVSRWHGDWTVWAGGTGNASGANSGASAVINVPIVPSAAGLRAVAYRDDEAGWIRTAGSTTTNATSTTGGRLAVSIALAPKWTIDLTGAAQTIHADDSATVYAAGILDRPAQAAEPTQSRIGHAAVVVQGPAGSGKLTMTASHTVIADTLAYDATSGAAGFGIAAPALFTEATHEQVWDDEVRYTDQVGRLAWVGGASLLRVDYDRDHTLIDRGGEIHPLDTLHHESTEVAAFADATWTIARRWHWDIGARLYRDADDAAVTGPGSISTAAQARRTGISPATGLSWQPADSTTVFMRLATAARPGEINRAAAAPSGVSDPVSPGDRIATIEAGARHALTDGGMVMVGLHASRWTHMTADMLLDSAIIATRDAGTARVLGGEVKANWSVRRQWWIDAGADFEDARLVRNETGVPLDDTRLPVVPTYTLAVAARRSFALWHGKAEAGMSVRRVGPGRLSFDPELDRRIAARWETGLSARIRWPHVQAGVRIDNLIDARSDTYAFGNPLRLTRGAQFVPMRPRTIMLSLGFRP